MRILLRDLNPGLDYAIQFRSKNGDLTSEWSQVQRFTTTNDTIRPGNVQNLTWYDSGSAFIGEWDKVTVDEKGNAFRDFRNYRCNVSTDGTAGQDFFVVGERFELTKEMNQATFGDLKTALTLSVTAVDLTYNESAIPAVVAVNPLNPATPSKPTVTQYLGLLTVSWDGKNAAGGAMASNVDYAEVHVSTTNAFTPTLATFSGRVYRDGSANKVTIPDLTVGVTYYVRLVAVNLIQKRSGPSAQAQGRPGRISGLDIQNGQISVDQINFTAKDIGGANAFYSTSQPTSGMKEGDIWYDIDDKYTTYRFAGGVWTAAPEIGVVTGTKIIAGTVTADAVGTNLLITSSANIGDAVIDSAKIKSLEAGKITTGSIAVDQRIIAGPEEENHAEMTSTGFYVKGPQPGGDPNLPPVIIDRIRMGTGVSDFFAIPDPLDPDSTLAQISEDGIGSFQNLYVNGDPSFQGKKLSAMLQDATDKGGGLVGMGYVGPITGLNQTGAAGIRDSEYGIGQFNFKAKAGHVYRVWTRMGTWVTTNGGEVHIAMRYQYDLRTPAEVAQNIGSPTPVSQSSAVAVNQPYSGHRDGWGQVSEFDGYFGVDRDIIVSVGLSMFLIAPTDATSVIKLYDGSSVTFFAQDLGKNTGTNGIYSNQGGTLYSWTAPLPPPPPPAPTTQQYYGEWRYNWIRSYKGNGGYMSNTDGRAYQGTDPSGYNGNQTSLIGFQGIDFTTLGPQIDRIVVYLYFAHWYYNAGGTARIGFTSQWNDPGGGAPDYGIAGTFDVGGWPKPGGLDIDVSGWIPYMLNGQFRGIGLGPGNNGYQNYGYATDCVLKVWYTR